MCYGAACLGIHGWRLGSGSPQQCRWCRAPHTRPPSPTHRVIKTDVCSFTEQRIYPGHGIRLARRDGQLVIFSTSKAKAMYDLRKKAAKLHWTFAWRRLNKKGSSATSSKKRSRRTKKAARSYVGMSASEVAKKVKSGPRVFRKGGKGSKAAIAEAKARAKK